MDDRAIVDRDTFRFADVVTLSFSNAAFNTSLALSTFFAH
jgi:hypothetical protein